jgi:hypothetical protein
MRLFKLISCIALVLAFVVLPAATASAEVEFLPGKGTFTTTSGKVTLSAGGSSITCTKLVTTGEFLSTTTALSVSTLEGCSSAGLAVNGLGDAAKTIKIHVEAKNCIVSQSPLVGGWLLRLLPTHIEVPSVKLLILYEGDLIVLLSDPNTRVRSDRIVINAKENKQEDRECKDGVGGAALLEVLTEQDDAGTVIEAAGEVKEDTITYEKETEFMT